MHFRVFPAVEMLKIFNCEAPEALWQSNLPSLPSFGGPVDIMNHESILAVHRIILQIFLKNCYGLLRKECHFN